MGFKRYQLLSEHKFLKAHQFASIPDKPFLLQAIILLIEVQAILLQCKALHVVYAS